jgi:hypothetical protein
MRFLQRFRQETLADLRHSFALDFDIPMSAFDVVGRLPSPDFQHRVYSLEEHAVAVDIEIAKRLSVGEQTSKADAEDKAPVQHVVEHCNLRGGGNRMGVWHIDRASTELHGSRRVGKAR